MRRYRQQSRCASRHERGGGRGKETLKAQTKDEHANKQKCLPSSL